MRTHRVDPVLWIIPVALLVAVTVQAGINLSVESNDGVSRYKWSTLTSSLSIELKGDVEFTPDELLDLLTGTAMMSEEAARKCVLGLFADENTSAAIVSPARIRFCRTYIGYLWSAYFSGMAYRC